MQRVNSIIPAFINLQLTQAPKDQVENPVTCAVNLTQNTPQFFLTLEEREKYLEEISSIARENLETLAGEELLLILFCYHVVGQSGKATLSSIQLIKVLSSLQNDFLSQNKSNVFNSLFSELSWARNYSEKLSNPEQMILPLLKEIKPDQVLQRRKQGQFSNIAKSNIVALSGNHPYYLAEHPRNQFHNWYALCFWLAQSTSSDTIVTDCIELLSLHRGSQAPDSTILEYISIASLLYALSPNTPHNSFDDLFAHDATLEGFQRSNATKQFCLALCSKVTHPLMGQELLMLFLQLNFDIGLMICRMDTMPTGTQQILEKYVSSCHTPDRIQWALCAFSHIKSNPIEYIKLFSQEQINHSMSLLKLQPYRYLTAVIQHSSLIFHERRRISLILLANLPKRDNIIYDLYTIIKAIRQLQQEAGYPLTEHSNLLTTLQWTIPAITLPLNNQTPQPYDRTILDHVISESEQLCPKLATHIRITIIKHLVKIIVVKCVELTHAGKNFSTIFNQLQFLYQNIYQLISQYLSTLGSTEDRKQLIAPLKKSIFLPLCFFKEFSLQVTIESGSDKADIVANAIQQMLDLIEQLLRSHNSSSKKYNKLCESYIRLFTKEIGILAKTAKRRRYNPESCKERTCAKNALIKLIERYYNKLNDSTIKQQCFETLATLKNKNEYTISESTDEINVEESSDTLIFSSSDGSVHLRLDSPRKIVIK